MYDILNPFSYFITEIDTSAEHAQLPSEANVVMERISMKDFVGGNLDATSSGEECLETAEESRSEETGPAVECKSNEPDIESVVNDEKMASNKELESNKPEIITITDEENETGEATCGTTEGGPADHVNEGSGDGESVSPIRTEHDSDAMEISAEISTPQRETCAQPTELFSCEKSGDQFVGIDETSTHEEKVGEGEKDLSVEVSEESKQNELTESTMAAQVTSEQSAMLLTTAGTESNLADEEVGCRDKEKFCDCLRSLKDLESTDVLRDLSSEEIFEAHHNLTEIMSVVVQALRGRWQSPRSKK